MKKLLFVCVLLILVSAKCFSQNDSIVKNPLTETDSLYVKAIEEYILYNETHPEYFLERTLQKIVYLQNENFLANIPDYISGYQIIKLHRQNRRPYYRKNKNKITLVEIRPLAIDEGKFIIVVWPYATEIISKTKTKYLISDWFIMYFKYEDGKLIHDKTEMEGI